MQLIFAVFVLYCIYPIHAGKRRWRCPLDASGIYTIIVFSSQKVVTVTNINLSGIALHQLW